MKRRTICEMASCARRLAWRRAGSALTCCVLTTAATGPALADAWIPSAGAGDAQVLYLHESGDRSFPADSFSFTTSPSTREHVNQIRLTGEHGLGQRFSLDYDLRFGFLDRTKTSHGDTVTESSAGPQDQRVTLNLGLHQGARFADAFGVGFVAPGSSASNRPRLDSGQWAIEPIYRAGFQPGFRGLIVDFDIASRLFADGGAAQFRSHVSVSAPLSRRVRLAAKLYVARTVQLSGYNDALDKGELNDVVRIGGDLKFRLTKNIEPVVGYESNIAGIRGHANHRISLGIKIKY